MSKSNRSNAGFTLIEVMIAMAILAMLAILTAQTLKTSVDNRAKVQADMNREAQVYDALRIMQADVAAAFHHRDIMISMINDLNNATPTPAPNPQNPPPNPPVNPPAAPAGSPRPTPPQTTGFVGEAESLYFTVSNHQRTLKDAYESDQAKVGYFLKGCKSRTGKNEATKCLFRAVSPLLDEDVTQVGDGVALLEHVEEFKLRYLGPGHEDYVEQWKFGPKAGGDEVAKENFPYAVEITLKIHNKTDKKEKPFGATVLAPIRFPNNPPKKTDPNQTPAPGK